MNKKLAILALSTVVALVLLLSGCSGSKANTNKEGITEGQGDKPVTITFWGRWEEALNDINAVIEDFQKEHKNITVKYTQVPPDQYTAQVQAAISGNSLPDIFGYHASVPVYQLANLGVLHELDDLMSQSKLDQYAPGTWTEGYTTSKGHIYALPVFNSRRPAIEMFYNKAVLKQAGLTEADVPKSWDELESFSRKVKEATNGQAYGLILAFKTNWMINSAVTQIATSVSPEVNPANQFNYKTGMYEKNSDGIVQTIEMLKRLQEEKLLHPNSLVLQYREATNLFLADKAALVMDGSYYASQVPADKLQDIGVAPLPTKDGNPQYRGFQGESPAALYVSNNTKNWDEVKLFLNYLTDHLYPRFMQHGVELSPIPSQNDFSKIENPLAADALKLQDQLEFLVPRPYERNSGTIEVSDKEKAGAPKLIIGDIAEGYLTGQISNLKSALDTLNNDSNKAFTEALNKVKADKIKVDASDFIFSDWTPLKEYVQ